MWAVSARSREIATTSRPDRANQWQSKTAARFPRQRRSTPAPFLYVLPALPGSCVRGETLCISFLTCVLMCACMCLCMCVSDTERVYLTAKTAVLVRARNRGSSPPHPQSRVPAFCENSLKLLVCKKQKNSQTRSSQHLVRESIGN